MNIVNFACSPIAINAYAFRRLTDSNQFANLINKYLLLKDIVSFGGIIVAEWKVGHDFK